MRPEFPTTFARPRRAVVTFTHSDLPPLPVGVIGLARYRSYDVARGCHYFRAMAVLDIGTMVGLYRVKFL